MIVLDASTALMSLLREPGCDASDLLLETQPCAMSIINVCETHERLLQLGRSNETTRSRIDELEMRVLPVDRRTAELAAILKQHTSEHGLGIADRICIATGMLHDARVFTADRAWERLDIPEADITVVR